MNKIADISDNDYLEMKHLNFYPNIKKSWVSKSILNYCLPDFKRNRIQEALAKRNIRIQVFHAIQNGLIDFLRQVNPNLWKEHINLRHPVTAFTFLHEAARSNRPDVLEFVLSKKPDVNKKAIKGNSALHLAVRSGNINCVQILCREKSLLIDNQDNKGQTALDIACRLKMIEIVQILISHGADPMKCEFDGMSCLHHPMITNHVELIELLLNVHCSPDKKDNNEISPIAVATNHGYIQAFSMCVQSIMDCQGNIAAVLDSQDSEGYSCFLNAVRYKQKEIMLECINLGANIDMRQNEGKNALHIAAEIGWFDIVMDICDYGININSVDYKMNTSLHLAIRNGNIDIVEYLLKRGANGNICNVDLCTPLLMSVALLSNISSHDLLKIMTMLLNLKVNVQIKNKKKQSILHLLVSNSQLDAIILLFQMITIEDKTLLLNSADENENSPLHIACTMGLEIICKYLVSEGADLFFGNGNESLPIHEAVRNGYLEIVQFLIEQNEDQFNIRNEDEENLILISSQSPNFEIFEYLFHKNTNIHTKDEIGNNILMYACQSGDIQMLQLILSKDFNIHMKNHLQNTPLHLAALAGQSKMVEYLLRIGAEIHENIYQHTALSLALENKHWDTARVFLDDNNWKKTMNFRFKTGKNHFGILIAKNEDIAYELLNRGLIVVSDGSSSKSNTIRYNFTFLDLGPHDSSSVNGRHNELMTMVEYQRERLIWHPLSQKLIQRRWLNFGSFAWIIDFITYVVFLAVFNYLIFKFPPPISNSPLFNAAGCPLTNATSGIIRQMADLEISMEFFLFIITIIRILIEFLKLVTQRLRYLMELQSYSFVVLYFVTLVFIDNPTTAPCQFNWSFGAMGIMDAWMILMFYFQKPICSAISYGRGTFTSLNFQSNYFLRRHNSIPYLGVPILMFKNVIKNVCKVLFLFINMMMGFAIAFYITNRNQLPFSNVGYSYFRSFGMMTGELDYVKYFIDPTVSQFTIIKLVLITLFIVIIAISMINVMIGLAVGNIDRMMNYAKLSIKMLQITYLTDVEGLMPKLLQARFYESVYVKKESDTDNKYRNVVMGFQDPDVIDNSDSGQDSSCKKNTEKKLQNIESVLGKIHEKLVAKKT